MQVSDGLRCLVILMLEAVAFGAASMKGTAEPTVTLRNALLCHLRPSL